MLWLYKFSPLCTLDLVKILWMLSFLNLSTQRFHFWITVWNILLCPICIYEQNSTPIKLIAFRVNSPRIKKLRWFLFLKTQELNVSCHHYEKIESLFGSWERKEDSKSFKQYMGLSSFLKDSVCANLSKLTCLGTNSLWESEHECSSFWDNSVIFWFYQHFGGIYYLIIDYSGELIFQDCDWWLTGIWHSHTMPCHSVLLRA